MNDVLQTTYENVRHSMYVRAEGWWWAALLCVVIGSVAALCLVRPFLPQGSVAYALISVLSVLSPVLAGVARWFSSQYAGRADLCRRAFLYNETLGEDLSIDERRIVALWPANAPLNKATTQAPYYSGNRQAGPGRLADAVGESAFYTAELARQISAAGFLVVAVVLLALASAVSALPALSLTASAQDAFNGFIGIVAIAVLTLFVCETLVITIAYAALARESDSIFKSACQFSDLTDQNVVTAIRLAESYSIALASNLPIPNMLYKRNRDRIDRAYRLAISRSPS